MKQQIAKLSVDAAIWERVIQFQGHLSPAAARALLKVQFPASDHERMHHLAAKARSGTLTTKEEAELDAYERLGCFLDILHSKARHALKRPRAGS
jgi:hypothetical protein